MFLKRVFIAEDFGHCEIHSAIRQLSSCRFKLLKQVVEINHFSKNISVNSLTSP